MSEFDDLILSNTAWMLQFEQALALLDDNGEGQLSLLPVEDYIATKRYVPCPRRGTHLRLVDCWMCWCDVIWGHATALEVLAAGDDPVQSAES